MTVCLLLMMHSIQHFQRDDGGYGVECMYFFVLFHLLSIFITDYVDYKFRTWIKNAIVIIYHIWVCT